MSGNAQCRKCKGDCVYYNEGNGIYQCHNCGDNGDALPKTLSQLDKRTKALRDADDYLESLNKINEISTGSALHKQFKEALKELT